MAGADQPTTLLAAASQVASENTFQGRPPADTDFTKPILVRVMLDMLRMDQAVSSQGARLTISALKALVQGLQSIPGRRSVLYFTWGMYETPGPGGPAFTRGRREHGWRPTAVAQRRQAAAGLAARRSCRSLPSGDGG